MHKIIVFSSIMYCSLVHAGNASTANNNFADELATCSAYFFILSEVFTRYPDPDSSKLSNMSINTAQSMLSASSSLTNPDRATARTQIAMTQMVSLLRNNLENFSVIELKYGNLCNRILQNPEERMRYWMRIYN